MNKDQVTVAVELFLRDCCQTFNDKTDRHRFKVNHIKIEQKRLYCLFNLWLLDTSFEDITRDQFDSILRIKGFRFGRPLYKESTVWLGIRHVAVPENILEQVELVAKQRAAFWRKKAAEITEKPFWAFWRTDDREAYESMANELESFPYLLRNLMP